MIFYQEWIPQGKVPVNAQTNRLVKVELDDGDVRDQLPASAVGLQAESTPIDSTRSNQQYRKEYSSVSPTTLVSEPTASVVRASTVMPLSNRVGRPDNNRAARYTCDPAIDNDVQVVRDSRVSHNGIPVTDGGYNDVCTSRIEVRVQGASPPADRKVLHGRAKGRTSSTPSANVYPCVRRSDAASFRSTVSTTMKSKFDMIPGDTPSPRRIEYASKDALSSNNLTPVLQPGMRMFSRTPSRAMGNYKVSHNAESTGLYASSTKSSTNNSCR